MRAAAIQIANRIVGEAIEMIANRLAFRYGLAEIGTDTFHDESERILCGPNHWLDERLTDEMPDDEPHPDERLNRIFFTARKEVFARVSESRRVVIEEARDRLLRGANEVTVQVTRTGIEILNVHCNY